MSQYITIQLMLVLLCLAEIPHDKAVIADSKFDQIEQKRWHLWSGIYYCMVVLFMAYLVKAPYYGALLLAQSFAIRLTVFGCGLNVARKGSGAFFYLSDKGIDGIIKKSVGGVGLFVACLVALILSNLFIKL